MRIDAQHSRRSFIRAVSVGTLAVGFDVTSRAWAAEAPAGIGADQGSDQGADQGAGTGAAADFRRAPHLDGRLLIDPADLAPYEDDYGHLVHRTPKAALLPGSVADIAAMIAFCGPLGIPVAPRGQGHQAYGQAQVDGGLVIDLGPLDTISVDPATSTATVGAGAVWSAVLAASLAHGLTPPVFTDYIELSVGGTLIAGGLGGASHQHGAQVDNVLELDVVTGTGRVQTCSAGHNADLSHATLSGLGQVGVITRAVIRLVPAPTSVRSYSLAYPTVAALTAAQRKAVGDGRFDWLEGTVLPASGGGWQYILEGSAFYDTTPPDDNALIGDLAYVGPPQIQDSGYQAFVDDLAPTVAALKASGEWYDPHPWFNGFLPDAATDALVTDTMAGTTPADLGASGLVLLYPVPTAKLTAPLLSVPEGELAFLFAVLRTAAPDGGALPAPQLLQANRDLYLRVQAAGGTQYPVGAIPMTPADWRTQYGARWRGFQAAKQCFDPYGILAPGQGIFAPAH
ncbi:FAD-binding protein [Catenulispora pinisilvae]|uniref:FAD-binding protein n=1 Tax=Catenulispora pinisilvae TaxID=2705253 RepID=UPI00189251BE|nr:FAD-binding protein [Catenulispora pinisilvae]